MLDDLSRLRIREAFHRLARSVWTDEVEGDDLTVERAAEPVELPGMDHATPVQEDDVLAERFDLVDAVRTEEDGELPLYCDLSDLLEQLERADGVDGARGLVEDQHGRFVQQRASELKARPHSRRECEPHPVVEVAETYCVEHVVDPRLECIPA